MAEVFQGITAISSSGTELTIEVEEYNQAIDVFAELTDGTQFDPNREVEVLEWVCGLVSLPPGQVRSANIVSMTKSAPSKRGRLIYSAIIDVVLATNKEFEPGDMWDSAALPAPGFGGPDTLPLWHYNSRAPDDAAKITVDNALSVALSRLARRWVQEGGRASVVPIPLDLVEIALSAGWPHARETITVMRELNERSKLRRIYEAEGRAWPGYEPVERATEALMIALVRLS